MITLKLCQKFPIKLDSLRTSSLASTSSVLSVLSASATKSQPGFACRRCIYSASAKQLTVEPRDLFSKDKPHLLNCSCIPQSITPYPFDDVITTNDPEAATTHVQVLEQWKQLLESLKAFVECLDCIATSVHDVSAVRQTLERHHLVKFFVKPYSYTAEDVANFVPGEPMCETWNACGFPSVEKPALETCTTSNAEMTDALGSKSIVKTNGVDIQQSCINQLEQESLLAVRVLSRGAWEGLATQYNMPGLAYANGTELKEPEASSVMLFQTTASRMEQKNDMDQSGQSRPNSDQLNAIQDYMATNLPNIFVKFHSYDIYTKDVIFENNWYSDQSYVTVGTTAYALEIAKLRLYVHLRYANVKMQLLKITTNETDGTVRVRWRISGIPQVKAVMFWKFLPWKNQSARAVEPEWLDGFSTYFVNSNGLIYKHKMDRIIPDEGTEKKKNQTVMEKLAEKIAAPVAPT